MLQVGFQPLIPAIKRPQTYALDSTATGIGEEHVWNICLLQSLPFRSCSLRKLYVFNNNSTEKTRGNESDKA
jgi:hypothetical protein